MDKKKLILFLVLVIFVSGMTLGSATASHTFKDSGYKHKISDKEYKKMKREAKKEAKKRSKTLGHPVSVYSSKHVTVSKIKYIDSLEKLKVGKTYKNTNGKKIKVLKLVKTYKGTIYGGGGYKYKVQKYAKMHCKVEYYKGKFRAYGVAYS